MPGLVCVQTFKGITPQTYPDGVRVIRVHHLPPDTDRHAVSSFLFPGNLHGLQPARFVFIKDGAAEIARDGHRVIVESGKVFGSGDVEIESARHLQIRGNALIERRNDDARVRPQKAAQRLAPALRLSEKILQPRLFVCGVGPA